MLAEEPTESAESSPAYDREYANSNRSLATGLAGSSVAIFTFAMFFLYDRAQSGVFDPLLFQVTVAVLLAAIFFFGFAGIFFYWLLEDDMMPGPRAARRIQAADVFFVLGLACMMIGPALILFTARLPDLGALGVAFWLAMVVLVLGGGRRSHW